MRASLTTRLGGGLEGGGDLGVHLDVEALIHQQLLVPLLHLLAHPGGECALQDGGADVGDPLLGQLRDLLVVGQVQGHLPVRPHEIGDVLDREPIVLRNGNEAHLLAQDALLRARYEVLQKVNGDLVYICEESSKTPEVS